MQLEWMGPYRDVVEALIQYCNIYAGVYRQEKLSFGAVRYSYSQIQVLEYLLEGEDRGENMSRIAERLGITRSNFTKIVQRLAAKGLVEKVPKPGSRRETLVLVTALGRNLYEDYSQMILGNHFAPMFRSLERLSPEELEAVARALREAISGSDYMRRQAGDAGKI